MEAARALRIGGIMSASATPPPALGLGVSRITGTARQWNEQFALLPGQLVGPHHPQSVDGRGQMLSELFGQARPGVGTSHEVRY
jgi:hypothetical protein